MKFDIYLNNTYLYFNISEKVCTYSCYLILFISK